MQFVNPYMLWGLILLAIPIIIHLFNFRRYKKVQFTNVRQLQEISIKTRKHARIKHFLTLILRMLAVFGLVVAFAGPYKSDQQKKKTAASKNKYVSVFIDNSFSMEASVGGVSLLDISKNRAIEIINAYSITDRFQLLTNDFSGKSQHFLNKESFIEEVQNVTFSPTIRSAKEIITRQKSLLDAEFGEKECYFISDFQKNTIDPSLLVADSSYRIVLMPLSADLRADIYVDSCWFETPTHRLGETNKLFVKLRGVGNELLQKLPVRLIINGKQTGLGNFDLSPNGETLVELLFAIHEKGLCRAYVEITDYPVVFDDKLFFTFSVSDEVNVIELNDNSKQKYLQSLFENDESFQYTKFDLNGIDYSIFSQTNLAVLTNSNNISSGLMSALEQFVEEGGTMALFASADVKENNMKLLLEKFGIPFDFQQDTSLSRFGSLNLNAHFFDGVFERIPDNMDMPSASLHYFTTPPIGSETIIRFENNDPVLIKIPYGAGVIYLFTVPLDEKHTNFPNQALFVPVMLRMALTSIQNQALYQTIGENDIVSVRNFSMTSDVPPQVIGEDQSAFIPGVRENSGQFNFYMHDNLQNAGFYAVCSVIDTLHLAYNYSRKESISECLSRSDIEHIVQSNALSNVTIWRESGLSIASSIAEMYRGVPLWRWFLLLTLLALLGEGLVLRFWK